MNIILCKDYEAMSAIAADIIAKQVKSNKTSVLGLPTGSTPIGTYTKLAEMCNAGEIDFSSVKTFNLDEYYPIKRDNDQSYYYFMYKNFFSKINIKPENVHVPNGEVEDAEKECKEYEEAIAAAGGIDLQMLGIGQNGHIGFNEPDSELYPFTHKTSLTENTILANARFFESASDVPTNALTMGMASILSAKKIIILINGANKKEATKALLKGTVTTSCPATLLNLHPDVTLICTEDAYCE